MCFAHNKLDEAEKAYARSVELAPYYRSGLLNLGVVKFARGKNGEARDVFANCVQWTPNTLRAQYQCRGGGTHPAQY